MDHFNDHTRLASSDYAKELWATLLSEEIKQPGSFSLKTMRVLSELDPDTARLFKDVASKRIAGDSVLKPPEIAGRLLEELQLLEEYGLIFGTTISPG